MVKQNLHTHTRYCDGINTPEEMVEGALSLDLTSIGFSGHAPLPIPNDFAMTPQARDAYLSHLSRLKEHYRDRIRIFIGVELDYYSEEDLSLYDYSIGSTHYVKTEEGYHAVDDSRNGVLAAIRSSFGGDPIAYARAYYENVVAFAEKMPYDIVGHFDLLTKYEEGDGFFGACAEAYCTVAREALHAVARHKRIFEVNTGAIARGYRTTPYPARFLLEEMHALGVGIVLTSDCHDARRLTCRFSEAKELLSEIGFRSLLALTEHGWEEHPVL